ncbi:hypothetical protein Tco_0719280 [Tanacetum coccineum]
MIDIDEMICDGGVGLHTMRHKAKRGLQKPFDIVPYCICFIVVIDALVDVFGSKNEPPQSISSVSLVIQSKWSVDPIDEECAVIFFPSSTIGSLCPMIVISSLSSNRRRSGIGNGAT